MQKCRECVDYLGEFRSRETEQRERVKVRVRRTGKTYPKKVPSMLLVSEVLPCMTNRQYEAAEKGKSLVMHVLFATFCLFQWEKLIIYG